MSSNLERRKFLKLAGGGGIAAAALCQRSTAHAATHPRDTWGLLIDTTRCVGCRACEVACTEVNGQRPPDGCDDPTVFDPQRSLDTDRYTIVNRASEPGRDGSPRFAKTQCMHCLEPACASACLTRALEKTPEGPVVYHPERCMGCRYCMVSCPFDVPKFEYGSATPKIQKCSFCFARQKEGKAPACAQVCPTGAVTAGKRDKLLLEAKQRVYADPEKYVQHVYGEREAGGTSIMYISDLPFEKLGLKPHVGEGSYAALTGGALGAVPFVMTLWPPLLMAIHSVTNRRNKVSGDAAASNEETHHE